MIKANERKTVSETCSTCLYGMSIDVAEFVIRISERLNKGLIKSIDDVWDIINELSSESIEVVPVIYGRWDVWDEEKMVGVDKYRHCHYNTCSKCGKKNAAKTNYCPNCGAKMDMEDNHA